MSSTPFQVLCLGLRLPDLITSAFGPFVLLPCANLNELGPYLTQQSFDAIWLDLDMSGGVDSLLAWPLFARAMTETAMVVTGPEPTPGDCLRLLQAGVREVFSTHEAAAVQMGRVLRLAIERKRLEDRARRAYSIDLTTGLPNHHQLLEHMTHLLALREREPAPMALIVLQLDGFQAVEASMGAEAANVLRRKAAVRIRASLRASDVVASLGRDMFAVLLAWMEAEDDAERVARKLLTSAGAPFSVAGQTVPVGARYGLGLYPAHGRDAQSLLRRAVGQVAGSGVGRMLGLADAANDGAPG